jgi:selenocysteine lyase/cysteine desulfurase
MLPRTLVGEDAAVKSYKRLFSRSLAAAPDRLHFAAHSHHLRPDATWEAHAQAWEDAALLADHKWEKIFGDVWPRAQRGVARELDLPSPETVVFAPSTHELVVRMASAIAARPISVLTTDGEFHSFRRQAARWAESGDARVHIVPVEPFGDFQERFLSAARERSFDLIYASHIFFNSGRVYERFFELAELARPEGPWVVIDGYHGFMAVPTDLSKVADRIFYVSGGYKYAMAGEGAAFMHAPPGFGARPVHTGWFAEFGRLSGPQGAVGFSDDASRFLGATFDATGLYRLNAVFDMLAREGLDTAAIAARVRALRAALLGAVGAGRCGRLSEAELLAPPDSSPHARFLAFRHRDAGRWCSALDQAGVVTDFRDDVLRIGFALYHDPDDIERFCAAASRALG